jgi:hypothetical protein
MGVDGVNGDSEAQSATETVQEGVDSHDLSPEEDRVLEALCVASRRLDKSEVLGRARIAGSAWWSTISSLRRRGLIIQEGPRRHTYAGAGIPASIPVMSGLPGAAPRRPGRVLAPLPEPPVAPEGNGRSSKASARRSGCSEPRSTIYRSGWSA